VARRWRRWRWWRRRRGGGETLGMRNFEARRPSRATQAAATRSVAFMKGDYSARYFDYVFTLVSIASVYLHYAIPLIVMPSLSLL
jgi:hypothetical protein